MYASFVCHLFCLEERSQEMMREKVEKRKLEQRIANLTSQMLVGAGRNAGAGDNGVVHHEDTPAFRTALKEQQERMKTEYAGQFHELERERQQVRRTSLSHLSLSLSLSARTTLAPFCTATFLHSLTGDACVLLPLPTT